MLRPARSERRRQDDDAATAAGPRRTGRRHHRTGWHPGAGARAGSAHEGRRSPADGQPRSGFLGAREPARLRPLLRHDESRDRGARTRAARFCRARAQGRRAHRAAVRRHETTAHAGARAGARPRHPVSRRADHRPGPAGAPPHLAGPAPAHRGRQDHRADYALHGRSRAPGRPARHPRPRPHRRRRRAARADRIAHRTGRGRDLRRRAGRLDARPRRDGLPALRNRRRNPLLLHRRCPVRDRCPEASACAALPAPSVQSGGRVPQAHREGSA